MYVTESVRVRAGILILKRPLLSRAPCAIYPFYDASGLSQHICPDSGMFLFWSFTESFRTVLHMSGLPRLGLLAGQIFFRYLLT